MSTTNIDKLYTPFQLAEDAKFDGTNLSGWQRAMLLHGATSGHDLYWKGLATWPFVLTKELTVAPPPDREADSYKPTAIFSHNPSQIEWTLGEGRAKIALLTNIKNPDALGKATDLGADIPDAQFKQILIDSFPSNCIWAAGKVIAYKAATVSEAVVDLTNTYLSYSSSNASNSTTVPALTTKPVYDVTALLAKINDFMKCNDSHEKVVCENKAYCGKKGHTAKECFTYGGGLAGQYTDWWKGPQNIHLHLSEHKNENAASAPNSSMSASSQPQASTVTTSQRPPIVL
jgi:hypothetical protein